MIFSSIGDVAVAIERNFLSNDPGVKRFAVAVDVYEARGVMLGYLTPLEFDP